MNPFKRTSGPSVLQARWFSSLLSICVLLLILAGFVEFYWRAEKYAGKQIKNASEKIPLLCDLKNKPSWIDKATLDQIFAETQVFAARDQETYDRLQNPQDQEILRAIAENYTGIEKDGTNRWTLRSNGWIKQITEVRRVIAPDRKSQTIEIYAEYRKPAAWVLHGAKAYLIDADMVRLPARVGGPSGEYTAADRKIYPNLMTITGLDASPKAVPAPSATWAAADLSAGMKLANLLRREAFISQIDAIDVSNFQGRKNDREPWIVLNTIWASTADASKPRVVHWGRPIGEEKFYEVSAGAKLKVLKQLHVLYNRIDANHDYVDIRTEQWRIPKPTQTDDLVGSLRG
jgi:hypothetical protein